MILNFFNHPRVLSNFCQIELKIHNFDENLLKVCGLSFCVAAHSRYKSLTS